MDRIAFLLSVSIPHCQFIVATLSSLASNFSLSVRPVALLWNGKIGAKSFQAIVMLDLDPPAAQWQHAHVSHPIPACSLPPGLLPSHLLPGLAGSRVPRPLSVTSML